MKPWMWVTGGVATLGLVASLMLIGLIVPGGLGFSRDVSATPDDLASAVEDAVIPYYISQNWTLKPLVTGHGYVECDDFDDVAKGVQVDCAEYLAPEFGGSGFGFILPVTFTDNEGSFRVQLSDDGSIPDVSGHL